MRYAAKYYDGSTARSQSVAIAVTDTGIIISTPEGDELARWPVRRVVLAELPHGGEPVRLGLDGTTARLIVDDAGVVEALRPVAPHLCRRVRLSWGLLRFVGWIAAAVGSLAVVLLFVVPSLSKQLAAVTPDAVRQHLGDTVLRQLTVLVEIDQSGPPQQRQAYCNDVPGLRTLEAMVARLTADMDEAPSLRLFVINTDMVNAFALPGGIVVLTKGFIDDATSAEEIAGVVAHEIGHIHHDHVIEGMYRTAAIGMLVGIVTGDFTGGILITGAAEWMLNSGYSRVDERAADDYALQRLYAVGIDSSGVERFYNRQLAESPEGEGALEGLISTHPLTRDRLEALRRAPRAFGTVFGGDGGEWRRLRLVCRTTQDTPAGT